MKWADRPRMSEGARQGGVVLLCTVALSMAGGVWIGRSRVPPPVVAHRAYYLISVSRVPYVDGDKWRVEYSLDGRAEAVDLPIKAGEPDGYLAYLHNLGAE
jgi:hypothetical protein